jgi:hypothetical protein
MPAPPTTRVYPLCALRPAAHTGNTLRGPAGRPRALPLLVPKKAGLEHCPLCSHGYLHMAMAQLHDHGPNTVMVITPDGLMHCTICHGRGLDLERVGHGPRYS